MFRNLLLIAALIPFLSFGQFSYFNSQEFWQKLVLRPAGELPVIHATDTAIVVASNRVIDNDNFRYLPEKRDGNGIRYFVVYSHTGGWYVHPVASLKQAVSLLPDLHKDWVVYTEGMGKFFTSGVDRGMSMAGQYGVNVLLLDYPSITAHKKRLANYFFAKKNAAIAHKDFTPVLDTIRIMRSKNELGNGHLTLFFHSMGNIMMREIVKKKKVQQLNQSVWADNLILNAPCIPQRRHKQVLDAITFAERIYISYNPADYTLGGAYLVSKRYQLGKQVRKPVCQKAVYINFNELVGSGHSYFLNLQGRTFIPRAAHIHYSTLFHGDTINIYSDKYRPSSYGIGYDILPK